MRRVRRPVPTLLCATLLSLACVGSARATIVYWVTNSANFGAGSYVAALQSLQSGVTEPQEIRFAFPAGQTIYLNAPAPNVVGANVRIDGADMFGNVVIDGGGQRIVNVATGSTTNALTIANLTLRHGQAIGKGGCVNVAKTSTFTGLDHVTLQECKTFIDASNPGRGGAVYAAGTLVVADSVFERNQILTLGASAETKDAAGGAVSSEGSHNVTIVRSAFRDNTISLSNNLPSFCASGSGGAVHLYLPGASSSGDLYNNTFTGNRTLCRKPGYDYDLEGSGDSGAAALGSDTGTFNIDGNFFENNVGNRGGAMSFINAGSTTVNLTNNTFHANHAYASGGAVGFVNCCYVNVNNNTFSDDREGVDAYASTYGAELAINVGSIAIYNNLFNNTDPNTPGCASTYGVVTGGHNLYNSGSCPIPNDTTSQTVGAMPWLGAPANKGGYVLVMPPAYGSPAIDTGDDAHCTTYDARGLVRPLDGNGDGVSHCDVGAMESSYVDVLFRNGFE